MPCRGFLIFGIFLQMYFSISFPRDSLTHEVWSEVLKSHGVHECGSSQYICSDHFTADDYIVSKDGKRARLRNGSVPSIFDVALIEYDDDDVLEDEIRTDEFHIEEIRELKTQNEKLQQKAEQLKCKYEHSVAISNSQINYYKEIKKQQAKKIQELKRQVSYLKKLVDTVKKEKDSMFGDLNVNVATFRSNDILKICFLCLFQMFRQNKNKSFKVSFIKRKVVRNIRKHFVNSVSQCTIIARAHMNMFVQHSVITYRTQAPSDHGMQTRI